MISDFAVHFLSQTIHIKTASLSQLLCDLTCCDPINNHVGSASLLWTGKVKLT